MNDCQNPCKQRFKGIENFLRRIAFNLGNSPSQTEVKIISCIPIDVTDLQQKILDLERLLKRTTKPPSVVHTALFKAEAAGNEINDTPDYPNQDPNDTPGYPNQEPNPDTQKILSYENFDTSKQNDIQPTPCSSTNSILEKRNNKATKNFFRKSKKKKSPKQKHMKAKSHMVYYAHQPENSPFRTQNVVEKKPNMKKKSSKAPNNSYLTDVIRRQYEPLMYKLSGESEFSSPVCRDIEHNYLTAEACASEICSCCLDFVNIDKNKADIEYFGFTPNFQDQIQSKNMFYDSSLYDLVPVKEAKIKHKKNVDISKRQQNKNEVYFPYYDYGHKPFTNNSMCVNYHTMVPAQPVSHSLPRRSCPVKKRRPMYREMDVRNEAEFSQDTSNSCRIECGNVYKKVVNKKPEPLKRTEVQISPVTYNNAKTATLQHTECQTTTESRNVETNSVPSLDDKTEETLNQIKTILQSVLTEVKTNTKTKTCPEQKAKKDAVVQKGASFGNMPGSSRLLNSFTYSPYNVAPYAPTYPHSMSPGQIWPGIPYPAKCMHNFPVFIQTPGRQQCSKCLRKPSHVSKPPINRGTSSHVTSTRATSASINTEVNNQNHETETLIKEIYKSMALNIAPKKDTSVSNVSSTPKRTSRTSTKSSFCYGTDKSVSAKQGTNNSLPQSLYRRAGPMTSGLTPFTSNMFSNKMTSNTVSVQSHVVSSTNSDRRLRNERLGQYLATTQEMPSEESAARKIMQSECKPPSTTSVTESSSEDSDDEPIQSVATKTEMQKKERNNLFTKMFNSVKLFKNRRRKSQKSKLESEEEDSDSDDYETVYSQQIEQARRAPAMQTRRIPHSKVSYSKQIRGRNQEKLHISPMEQEYRRQWNEQFMWQQHPYAAQGGRRRDPPGYYGQNYEARPAMIERSVHVNNFMNQDCPVMLPKHAPQSPKPGASPAAAKGLAWFKKNCKCGEHFKSLIVDN